ncbi:MAG TPA: hypothetical protein VEF33_10095 [Syntrophales bacterium]|nr:hypothetical protein [Syntrophales bacterium]
MSHPDHTVDIMAGTVGGMVGGMAGGTAIVDGIMVDGGIPGL